MSLKHATLSAGIVSSVYGMTLAPFILEDILFQTVIVDVHPIKQRDPVAFISLTPAHTSESTADNIESVQEEEVDVAIPVDNIQDNLMSNNVIDNVENIRTDDTQEPEEEFEAEPELEEEIAEDVIENIIESEAEEEACILSDETQMMFVSSISQMTNESWHVDREMVEFYANSPFKLRRLAGTWTYRVDGEKIGFRIRPTDCSILFDAGFQSDDVVTSINGTRVSTLLEAVGAYFTLRGQSTFTVNMLRDGEDITQVYTMDKTKRELRRERRERQRDERRDRRRFRNSSDAVVDGYQE
mgnify:CR=1 FL=1|tara:strand:+ start:2033 stop:2929 length:897 start_codon:yes stop_codon:yes gene_type:complete